jgi:hypothetical protein
MKIRVRLGFSMKTLVLLKQFHNSANKSGLSDSDQSQFEEVVFCSWETKEVISRNVFLKVLRSNAFDESPGFSQEVAEILFRKYQDGLSLLDAELNTLQ